MKNLECIVALDTRISEPSALRRQGSQRELSGWLKPSTHVCKRAIIAARALSKIGSRIYHEYRRLENLTKHKCLLFLSFKDDRRRPVYVCNLSFSIRNDCVTLFFIVTWIAACAALRTVSFPLRKRASGIKQHVCLVSNSEVTLSPLYVLTNKRLPCNIYLRYTHSSTYGIHCYAYFR